MVTRIGPRSLLRPFLFEWREAKGLTQQKLADLLDTNKENVSRWENGKHTPSEERLAQIAYVLGLENAGALYRHPEQPSVDELLRDKSPDTRAAARDLIETFLRRAS